MFRSEKPTGTSIMFQKLYWPFTVWIDCSRDQENFLKFKSKGQEFAKVLRPLEQFIQTVKGQDNFW